jgi:hypothetical protein
MTIPLLNQSRWFWHLCDCMKQALRAEEDAQEDWIAQPRYDGMQLSLDGLFPQWTQSAKAPVQTFDAFVRTGANSGVL